MDHITILATPSTLRLLCMRLAGHVLLMVLLIGVLLSIGARRAAAQQTHETHATQPVHVGESAAAAPVQAAVVYREPTREWVTRPRPRPLRRGLWTLSVLYVTSVVVAVVSPRAVDNYLLIPVAGPWLDLANRDDAGNNKYETLYKVLLITDGVIQAIGVAQIAWSIIFPETRLVQRAHGRDQVTFALRAAPLLSRHTVGLQAGGIF